MAQKDNPKTPEDGAWSRQSDAHVTDITREKPPVAARAATVALWLVGLALEVFAVLVATDNIAVLQIGMPARVIIVAACVVVDLLLTLVAARLWRNASQADRRITGRDNPHLALVGAVGACIAFVPMVLFFATSKNAEKRLVIAAAAAALATAAVLVVLVLML